MSLHKMYESYRYRVMWHHPKFHKDPEQYDCYYESNFLDYAKYYALRMLGKGATVFVYDADYDIRVKDFETHEKEKPAKINRRTKV